MRKVVLLTVYVVAAAILQTTLFARLHLAGAAPNLVALVVIAAATELSDTGAALCGFCAGLFVDLLSETPLGLWAASLAIVGYLVCLGSARIGDAGGSRAVAVIGGSLGAEGLFVGLGAIFGQSTLSGAATIWTIVRVTLYNLPLALVVVPLVRRVAGVRRDTFL